MRPKRMKLIGNHGPDDQDETREKWQLQTKKQTRQTCNPDIVQDCIHSRNVSFGYDRTAKGRIDIQNKGGPRIVTR